VELNLYNDEHWMGEALREAQKAYDKGEVPVGAVVVSGNKIIGRGHNLTEQLTDVTAHAEMQAITAAANYLGGKYLPECTLYVTLEPCVMCAGALFWSQMSRVVIAAADPKRGFQTKGDLLHPKTQIHWGVQAEAASALLKRFFSEMRQSKG
jgi:tRNA(adenine34) deaminase